MTTVSIVHPTAELPRYFAPEDLARLRAAAAVQVLGDLPPPQQAAALARTEILLSSWGMPELDATLLAAAPRLRAACYAAGSVKGFVTPASWARGIVVTTAMHANAVPVAEVSAALIILANKHWFAAQARLRATRTWQRDDGHPGNFRTPVGLIGFGAIGRLVAERLRGSDLDLRVYDPYARDEALAALGCRRAASLAELAAACLVVSVHAPNIPQTQGMCDAAFFRAMRDGACFINTARGALVDEAALIAELRTGRITAHLDVTEPEPPAPDSPFWSLPNCHLTPHLAGSTAGEIRRMGRLAIEECLRIIAGQPPLHAVTEAQLATMA